MSVGPLSDMVEQLTKDSEATREWNGRGQHFYGRVRLNESPLKLRLWWKDEKATTRSLIGVYKLNLQELLKRGYIRTPIGYPGEVILRFQRTASGEIQIAINQSGRPLPVGKFTV